MLCVCRAPASPDKPLAHTGDEMVVAGRFFHTSTPVITWLDPGGYDAYQLERRFSPWANASWKVSSRGVRALLTPRAYH